MKNEIIVNGDTKVLTVLEGKALTPREPKQVVINGTISAPRIYLEKRSANKSTDHIVFSKDEMTISFIQNEKDELCSIIKGSLVTDSDLKKFNINPETSGISTKEMASFLKRNRYFFIDKDVNAKIVTALNTFTATITTELEKHQDGKGNKRELVEKKVISNIDTSFNLEMPIFKGQKEHKFTVDVCFDTTDTGVKCWLESAELFELILATRDAVMEQELKLIAAICGLPIIEM